MDGRTMQQIRENLLERWRKFERNVQEQEIKAGGEIYSPQAEIIDMAQALEQIGRDTSLQKAERRELLAIEKALAKMATGNFGICEECGEEIPPKRLMVLPEARLCANCQALEEKHNARMRLPGLAGR